MDFESNAINATYTFSGNRQTLNINQAIMIASAQIRMLPHVLVVTASLASKDLNRARSYGVADIVAKPFDVESLLEAVKKCAGVEEKGTRINMMASAPIILFIADLLKDKIS